MDEEVHIDHFPEMNEVQCLKQYLLEHQKTNKPAVSSLTHVCVRERGREKERLVLIN